MSTTPQPAAVSQGAGVVQPSARHRWRQGLSGSAAAALTALAQAPQNAAYGLIAWAPLGVLYGPTAMALALLGAVAANAVASCVGAGRLVNGPGASLALLTAHLVAGLSAKLAAQGQSSPVPVVLLSLLGLVLAGGLQMLFGAFRLGSVVKFTPHPVRVGVTSGVGLLLMLNALPVMVGHEFGSAWTAVFEQPAAAASGVAATAVLAAWGASRLRLGVPPAVAGLAVAALLQALIAGTAASSALGGLIGVPTPPSTWVLRSAGVWAHGAALLDRDVLLMVGGYALTVAVLSSLDTLMSASVVDGRWHRSRDANRELVAQGLANMAAAAVGGQPASPSLQRSMALNQHARVHRHGVLLYALTLLVLLLAAPQLFGLLPASAVAGVLLWQGAQMVSPTLWRTPLELWHLRRSNAAASVDHQARLRVANGAVALVVALNAVWLGIGPAVLIGASFAVLLFVRANMRDVVRQAWSGQSRRSLKLRPAPLADLLAAQGKRIVVLELEGSLFFGTADGLRVRLQNLAEEADEAILDLHQVNEIDVTAARILFETAEDWSRRGKRLVFAEWQAQDNRRGVVEAVATDANPACLHFADHTDLALEQAEDRLLAQLNPETLTHEALNLADTMIGRGLDAEELCLLAQEMDSLHFARGALLFRVGDPGDALFISLKGDIGLRIPGSGRRLVSFAPGVMLGEMSVLAQTTRSAEAVAESEVTALRLPAAAFNRLLEHHPALAAKLMKNISLHLADRVRTLTGDLSAWVARAAAGRPSPDPSPAPPLQRSNRPANPSDLTPEG